MVGVEGEQTENTDFLGFSINLFGSEKEGRPVRFGRCQLLGKRTLQNLSSCHDHFQCILFGFGGGNLDCADKIVALNLLGNLWKPGLCFEIQNMLQKQPYCPLMKTFQQQAVLKNYYNNMMGAPT